MVLTDMGGDWSLFRSLPKRYRARLVATKRVMNMWKIAHDRDDAARRELRKDERGRP